MTALPAPSFGADTGQIVPLITAIRAIEAAVRTALYAIRGADNRQIASEEGMAVEAALRCYSGAGSADIATLQKAADLLDRLPGLDRIYTSGHLPWAHLRLILVETRRFRAHQHEALDSWFDQHGDRLAQLDRDHQAAVLRDAIDQLATVRTADTADQRLETVDRFVLQLQLDGSSESYGTWSPEATALLADALHTEADAPVAAPCPTTTGSDSIDVDDPDPAGGGPATSRAGQLAAALLRLITRGRAQPPTTATPPARMTVLIDLEQITDRVTGVVNTALPGRQPRVVTRTLERLSCDAAVDTVIRRGTNLLAAQRHQPDVSAATRRAITARDGGCRWPNCTAPISWCDVHHVNPRAAGGDHTPTNLVLLCRRHHTAVHRRGWRQTLDSDDATYILKRRGRTIASIPRHLTGIPPPPPPVKPAPTGAWRTLLPDIHQLHEPSGKDGSQDEPAGRNDTDLPF